MSADETRPTTSRKKWLSDPLREAVAENKRGKKDRKGNKKSNFEIEGVKEYEEEEEGAK